MRAFAQERLAPPPPNGDRNHTLPREALNDFAELGALGMVVPEEWGGAGMDYMSLVPTLEEIAAATAPPRPSSACRTRCPVRGILNRSAATRRELRFAPLARGENSWLSASPSRIVNGRPAICTTSGRGDGNEGAQRRQAAHHHRQVRRTSPSSLR